MIGDCNLGCKNKLYNLSGRPMSTMIISDAKKIALTAIISASGKGGQCQHDGEVAHPRLGSHQVRTSGTGETIEGRGGASTAGTSATGQPSSRHARR